MPLFSVVVSQLKSAVAAKPAASTESEQEVDEESEWDGGMNEEDEVEDECPQMPPVGTQVEIWYDEGDGGGEGWYTGRVSEVRDDNDALIEWEGKGWKASLVRLVGRDFQAWRRVGNEVPAPANDNQCSKRKRKPPPHLTYKHRQGQEACNSRCADEETNESEHDTRDEKIGLGSRDIVLCPTDRELHENGCVKGLPDTRDLLVLFENVYNPKVSQTVTRRAFVLTSRVCFVRCARLGP